MPSEGYLLENGSDRGLGLAQRPTRGTLLVSAIMMKKLFYGGGNDKSSWVGKVLYVGRHQCLIEEIIAEGK